MGHAQRLPFAGAEAGLFEQFALGGSERFFSFRAAALRDFPRITPDDVTILTDQVDITLFIQRNDSRGFVLEVNDTIDAGRAIGPDHLVFTHVDPWVVVNTAAADGLPGIGVFIFHWSSKYTSCTGASEKTGLA